MPIILSSVESDRKLYKENPSEKHRASWQYGDEGFKGVTHYTEGFKRAPHYTEGFKGTPHYAERHGSLGRPRNRIAVLA